MGTALILQGAYTGLGNAIKLIKAISNQDKSVAVNSAKIELQQIIMDAQAEIVSARIEHTAMLDKIRDLEKEMADIKTWESEKQNYELKRVGYGSFAYVIKDTMKGTEPSHWICATCYQDGKKSILQSIRDKGIHTKCFTCKSQIDANVPHIPTFLD